jgi:ATPase family protein associated with various cellular activities (AAA)
VINMTESCSAIRRNGALAGGRAALRKQEPTRTNKETNHMNKTVSVQGDAAFNSVMADLGLDFALSPIHRIGFDLDERGIQLLSEHYHERLFRTRRWSAQEKLTWQTLLLRFDEGVYMLALGDGRNCGEVIAPSAEAALATHRELHKVLKSDSARKQPAFYMLRYDYTDFEADPIENLPESVDEDFLRLCYGDDIVAWIAKFNETTVARAGGLTIFEGPPGTGKTSLLTQMIRELEKTHVFYVLPVARDGALSSPELVPFWQRQNARYADRVKVIVMEDAERLLWRRDGDNREAVSSLLNIADGLMGRMLRLHVICSVNARMEDLDPAVLRPGRLMNHRRFKLLPRATAEQIASKRKTAFRPRADVAEYTLADVLNPGPRARPADKRSIGFSPMAV